MPVAVHDPGLSRLPRLLGLDPDLGARGSQPDLVPEHPGAGELRHHLDGAAPGGPVYVVPRSRDIVVGGTDDEGEWDRRPDPEVARRILERAVTLVPALAEAQVIRHRVGLRPARPAVRLEAEESEGRRLVHCYGHGGAGVTLSWGCADEVALLVGT